MKLRVQTTNAPAAIGPYSQAIKANGFVFASGQIVKTTVFLADMQDFAPMNEVYSAFFRETPPARATVAAAGLPRNARVEIEVVALT